MEECYITIFTPTYNRCHLLVRLYESLLQQSCKNFEWLIVDDESEDDTEKIVLEWMKKKTNGFPIRYYKQEHGGKHRALNKGFGLAKGIYFFIVDSDDYLTKNATELIEVWGKQVENRKEIAGVSGTKISSNGNLLGGIPITKTECNWVEASNFEREKYHLTGDKAEAYKTSILKQYSFPEFKGEYFVTEAVCWDAIAADGYKLRWYNEPIYQCEYLEEGLTKSGANGIQGSIQNYKGYCYYVSQCLKVKNIWGWSGNLRQYNKVARSLHKGWKERANNLNIKYGKYVFNMTVIFPFVYTIKLMKKGSCMIRSLMGEEYGKKDA